MLDYKRRSLLIKSQLIPHPIWLIIFPWLSFLFIFIYTWLLKFKGKKRLKYLNKTNCNCKWSGRLICLNTWWCRYNPLSTYNSVPTRKPLNPVSHLNILKSLILYLFWMVLWIVNTEGLNLSIFISLGSGKGG